MSSYSIDRSVRCWTCKTNGIDRYFDGSAERQLHESTMHASTMLSGNFTKTSTPTRSVMDKSLTGCTRLGSPFRESRLRQAKPVKKTNQMVPYYTKLEQLKERVGCNLKLADASAMVFTPARYEGINENEKNIQIYERESFNIKLQEALRETDAKRSMVRALKENLNKTELTLMQSRERESQLEDQLNNAQREMKKISQELNQVADIAEAEKLQRFQMQKDFENQLNSQNSHIIKLREELEKQRLVIQENNEKNELMLDLEMKIKRYENELAFETRLKTEAKKEQEECRKETEDLLTENRNITKTLKQCQRDYAELQSEHKDLIEEYNALADIESNEALQMKMLEAEDFLARKFNDERISFANDIEAYRKQCESLEHRCQNYERMLDKSSADLKKARDELDNMQSYRKEDIETLLKEKEILREELKAKKAAMHKLESSNDDLASKLSEKEKQIRKLEMMKPQRQANLINYNEKEDYLKLEAMYHSKCDLVEELQKKIDDFTKLSSTPTKDEIQANETEENAKLKKNLKGVVDEKNSLEAEVINLKSKCGGLQESLKASEAEKRELNASLKKALEEIKSIEEEMKISKKDLKSKEEEISSLKKTKEDIKKNVKEHDDSDSVKLKALQSQLEASFEEERQDMNEKLDQVLEANVTIEEKCNQLEATLSAKEIVIKKLQATVEEKMLKEKEHDLDLRSMISHDLKESQKKVADLELTLQQIEKDLAVKVQMIKESEEERQRLGKELQEERQKRLLQEEKATSLQNNLSDSKGSIEMLNKTIEILEDNVKSKDNMAQEAKEQNRKLAEVNEEQRSRLKEKDEMLESLKAKEKELKSAAEKLESTKATIKSLESNLKSFEKIKEDFKLKQEEHRQSQAKQNDLLKKIQDKENQCKSLDSKLKEAEKKCKRNEAIRKSIEAKLTDLKDQQSEVADDFQRMKNKLIQLNKDKIRLEKENEDLTQSLEQLQMPSKNDQNDSEKVQELQKSLENMRKHEKKIQSHNYEIKKKLEAEEVERKKLKEDLDRTNLLLKEKQNEIILLEKRSTNYEELSVIAEKRALEVKAKSKYIEEADEKINRLAAEAKKLERMVTELKENLELLKKERNGFEKEKEVLKTQLKDAKGALESQNSTEKDLQKALEDIKALKDEKKCLENKCDELKKRNNEVIKGDESKNSSCSSRSSSESKSQASECDFESDYEDGGDDDESKSKQIHAADGRVDYESDFEEEDDDRSLSHRSNRSRANEQPDSDFEGGDDADKVDNGDEKQKSLIDDASEIAEEIEIETYCPASEDDDDFWNILDKKPLEFTINSQEAETRDTENEKKSDTIDSVKSDYIKDEEYDVLNSFMNNQTAKQRKAGSDGVGDRKGKDGSDGNNNMKPKSIIDNMPLPPINIKQGSLAPLKKKEKKK